MADNTLFGLVRDIQGRRENARVRDVLRENNYFNNPVGAIEAVNNAGYLDQAVALRSQEAERQAAAAKAAEGQQSRYRTALQGLTSSLIAARDKPDADLGVAYDSIAPTLVRGFGMAPEEVVALKQQITANPQILDQFTALFADPNKSKFGVLPGGGAVFNEATGEITGRNPGTIKTVTMKRGDGGSDLYIIDESGNLVQSGVTTPGVPAGSSPVAPGSVPSQLNIDPRARGVRNNNAGNIKDGPWAKRQPGYAGSDGTFARFESAEAGNAAQEALLGNHYVNGQRSVNDIVNKYLGGANNAENSAASQANYKAYVAQRLGIPADQPVPREMLPQLSQAMREFENGTTRPTGPGPVASTEGKPQAPAGWRDMTPEEKTQRGLDPARAYQIGVSGANTGRIQQVGGQPTPKGAGPNGGKPGTVSAQAHVASIRNLEQVRNEARALRQSPAFGQATGSIQGRLPSIFSNTKEFDDRLESYVGRTVVDALLTMKQNSPNGATGFGAMNTSEGNWLKQSQGSMAPTSPDNLRRTLETHERDAMISIGMAYNIPPDATMLLIRDPRLRAAFDAKYGAGLAKKILGK